MKDVSQSVQAKRFRVEGRVQGVGFRYYVYHWAVQLGLRGYVLNLPDGAVEVYAIGPFPKLDEFREKLWRGPSMARVGHLHEEEAEVDADYRSFQIEGG